MASQDQLVRGHGLADQFNADTCNRLFFIEKKGGGLKKVLTHEWKARQIFPRTLNIANRAWQRKIEAPAPKLAPQK